MLYYGTVSVVQVMYNFAHISHITLTDLTRSNKQDP